MPFNLGPAEVIIILVIVLIVFGVGRLPEVGGALGQSIREFRRAQEGLDELAEPKKQESKASEKEE
jgi:sec-independent protein translocase protein TatA